MIQYLLHVPHSRVSEYEALGWIWVRFALGAHGCHSALMKWAREGEPREPAREEEGEAA